MGHCLQCLNLLTQARIVPAILSERVKLQVEHCELLPKLIVHFAGDAGAFLFLSKNEATQKLTSFTLGTLSFTNFGLQGLVCLHERDSMPL